ncbi:ASCH domain-containing protein [Pseudomonas protegens]|uniref:ASCH domain-containing protein n=1 Tax=Pseudomonas protegens TaxID=380021 RepID=UPI00223C1AAC|nr:ASCH domain-containing protein [Pseudomonas protegens]
MRANGGRIASGEKTLGIRRWHPHLDPSEDLLIVENGRFLYSDGDEDEDGIAVAIVRVTAVRPFALADMQAACASNFEEGRLAWELSHARPITDPVTLRAARGIYEVDSCPPAENERLYATGESSAARGVLAAPR